MSSTARSSEPEDPGATGLDDQRPCEHDREANEWCAECFDPPQAWLDARRPVHHVDLRHDTTMWNERFSEAIYPYATVAVASDADRDFLVAWVDATFGLRPSREDSAFFTQVHAAYPDERTFTLDGAKRYFAHAVGLWQGL